ncbi:hypothetical protein [Granulicella sibirica]|uniref:Uncharacterized protein n=1 Tax=Granulicella sibirica TaxID=2479048 RepID=A0A4Q0T485_9BACT|nr:hypothetical protein [Granulicella sibirica]RXH56799.1 hypothetical protein GRAN_0109 [Granulicella sibirica]
MNLRRKILLIGLVVGLAFGAMAFWIRALSVPAANPAVNVLRRFCFTAALPGVLLSDAAVGSGETAPVWAYCVGNFFFYFFLCWCTGRLVLRFLLPEQDVVGAKRRR